MSIHLMHRQVNRDMLSYWRQNMPAIPAGLILPGHAISTPAGWEKADDLFPGTDDLVYVMGLGTNLGVKNRGDKVERVDMSATITAAGGHGGSNYNFLLGGGGGVGSNNRPDHDHNGGAGTALAIFSPARHVFYPYRATADTEDLPAEICFMAADAETRTGMTRFVPQETWGSVLLLAKSTQGAESIRHFEQIGPEAIIPTEADHSHGTAGRYIGGNGPGDRRLGVASGGHDHGGAKVFDTWSAPIQRIYLNFWYSATAVNVRSQPGFYALWDKPQLPEGWAACAGARGLVDTANNYITMCYAQSEGGTKIGTDNRVTGSGVTATAGEHNHDNGYLNQNVGNFKHFETIGGHTHNVSIDAAWEPQRVFVDLIKRLY